MQEVTTCLLYLYEMNSTNAAIGVCCPAHIPNKFVPIKACYNQNFAFFQSNTVLVIGCEDTNFFSPLKL